MKLIFRNRLGCLIGSLRLRIPAKREAAVVQWGRCRVSGNFFEHGVHPSVPTSTLIDSEFNGDRLRREQSAVALEDWHCGPLVLSLDPRCWVDGELSE